MGKSDFIVTIAHTTSRFLEAYLDVDDVDAHPPLGDVAGHLHGCGPMLEGVAEQVVEDLPDSLPVHLHVDLRHRTQMQANAGCAVGRLGGLHRRPEHITQPQDQKNDQTLVAKGEFTIEVTEPTGPDVIALIQLNDTNVHCRIDPEHPVTWGETAELMFDMKKVVFFDPDTEKRIAPH